MSTGAEVNRPLRAKNVSSASGVQEKGRRVEVRAVSGAETSDEATVKVCKAEEAPELGAMCGSRPLFHHSYLLGFGPNLSLLQDVSQELHRGHVEHALLGLDEEPVLQQPLKDQTDVGGVFLGGLGENQFVI